VGEYDRLNNAGDEFDDGVWVGDAGCSSLESV
jgi:hypothetical protein